MLTEGQREWVKAQLHLLREMPERRERAPRSSSRRRLHALVTVRGPGVWFLCSLRQLVGSTTLAQTGAEPVISTWTLACVAPVAGPPLRRHS
jgi:hypothetical protein